MINRAVPLKEVRVVFIRSDEMINKCLYNISLVVQRIRRATLAGFGENNAKLSKYSTDIPLISSYNRVIQTNYILLFF